MSDHAVLDHLVYATPDLAATVDELNRRCGVDLTPGGRQLGLGTHNFLAELGNEMFLEVIGPDPEQPAPEGGRAFGVDYLSEPRLLTWAARVYDLDESVRNAKANGYDLGPIMPMSRDRGDGVPLNWRLAVPHDNREFGGLVPFLIDWGSSAHPAETAAHGIQLTSFTGFFPDVARVELRLKTMGHPLPVEERSDPGLRAVLETPAGEVVLT